MAERHYQFLSHKGSVVGQRSGQIQMRLPRRKARRWLGRELQDTYKRRQFSMKMAGSEISTPAAPQKNITGWTNWRRRNRVKGAAGRGDDGWRLYVARIGQMSGNGWPTAVAGRLVGSLLVARGRSIVGIVVGVGSSIAAGQAVAVVVQVRIGNDWRRHRWMTWIVVVQAGIRGRGSRGRLPNHGRVGMGAGQVHGCLCE